MSSIVSKLDLQRENQLMKLLPDTVRLHQLYKGSHHGFDTTVLTQCHPFDKAGQFVILVYLKSGSVRGAYLSKPLKEKQVDENAFLFALTPDSAFQYLQREGAREIILSGGNLTFGKCLQITCHSWKTPMIISFGSDETFTSTGWKSEPQAPYSEVELHRVQEVGDMLNNPWRELSWSDKDTMVLKKKLINYKPAGQDRVRVLLLGPAGSGKSSFINSVKSALYGRVMLLPVIGSATKGVSKRLKSSHIWSEQGGKATALTLVDVPAVGDNKERSGLPLSDTLAVIKGRVPEGHKFVRVVGPIEPNPLRPEPTINDEIHGAVFVLNACHITSTSESLQETLRRFQAEIADMDIPQVVLLTHVDQVCRAVQKDVQHVYTSRIVQEKMHKAAEVVGLPVSYVFPVRNYSSQQSVNSNMDILILSAVNHILQAVYDAYEERRPLSSVQDLGRLGERRPPSSFPTA